MPGAGAGRRGRPRGQRPLSHQGRARGRLLPDRLRQQGSGRHHAIHAGLDAVGAGGRPAVHLDQQRGPAQPRPGPVPRPDPQGPGVPRYRNAGRRAGNTANNGVADSAEPGLPGVGVRVQAGGRVYSSGSTDADGAYALFVPVPQDGGPAAGQPIEVAQTNPQGHVSTGASVQGKPISARPASAARNTPTTATPTSSASRPAVAASWTAWTSATCPTAASATTATWTARRARR